ncbi:MAG TPA: enoyl-ACP reductase [Bryobacteraceae bacterium]|nr:enoyl-ACP reductase [Bryobacteraceae bacterium]
MSGILQGKTAVVAGIANKWSIAYAIAQAFSREGADVVLTYLNEKQKETIESIAGDMRVVKMLPLDVTRDEDLQGLGEGLKELGRPIDVLVHSLAFANREDLSNPFIETSREGFLLAQNVSAYSLVAMARAVAPLMPSGGSVMTLSYLGATRVMPHYNVMGTAKAALESSMRYLASDLGPRNIRVNAISAGAIKTASARAVKDLSAKMEWTKDLAPMKRLTDPGEVADTAVFLASDLSRGVTGNVLFVDAGMHIV